MSNKAVLPAGKDTIGVRYIEDEGTNIETVLRSTNYVAGTSGYNFTLNGTAGTATLDTKDDVTISSNYSVGVSGARIFMDGSTGDISLIATNDVLLDAAYVAGVSGAKLFLDRSLNRIEGSCGDFIASAFNDIYLSSNYSAGVSGVQMFMDGSAGELRASALKYVRLTTNEGSDDTALTLDGYANVAYLQADNDVVIEANYAAGVSGAQIFMDGSAGTATLDAKGNISLPSNFSSGVSGSRININANGDIAQECASSFYMVPQADFNAWAGNDVAITANYSAGVSGARIFMDGSAGTVEFVSGGSAAVKINSTSDYRNYSINNATTGSAANVYIQSADGRMFRSTSAAKYKTDIQPLSEESLEANLNIQGVFYRSLCENDCKQRIHVGIVADQAEQYAPWLMHYGVDSELEGFQYERQTAFNLEHIKRLNAKLEDALERINELEEILYGEPDLDTL